MTVSKMRVALLSVALCSVSTSALAQTSAAGSPVTPGTPTPSTPVTDPTPPVAGLGDIVVTAQRRTETLQRAAVPVDVIRPEILLNAGIVRSDTLNAAVPSLIVTQAGGANTSYYLRGVGNFTSNAYADPAVAFNYDGVYVGRPSATNGTFYDLDRIEVLKGPQGTLYGRNATGGAINVIPAKPKIGETSGYGSFTYGNFRTFDGEGAINLPIGDSGAVRVAGKVVSARGYNDDGTNDEVGQAFRVQALANLTDTLSVRVSQDWSHQGGAGPGASFNGVYSFAPGAPATPNSINNYVYTPAPSSLGPRSGLLSPNARQYFSTFVIGGAFINPAPNQYPFIDNTYYGTNAEINWKTGAGTLTFIPAFRAAKINTLFNGPAFQAGINQEHDDQVSAELRFTGNRIGPLDYIIGGYYFDEGITAKYAFSQYLVNVYQEFTTGTRSLAGFGRATLHFSDRLRAVGAVRYTDDRKRFNANSDTVVQLCTNPPPPFGPGCFGGPTVPVAGSLAELNVVPKPSPNGPPVPFGNNGNLILDQRFVVNNRILPSNRLTYRAAGEFDLAPRSLLYASYETGYHAGGFSLAQGYETYQPEYLTAITVGSKNRFFDNKVQLNIELYRWKYRNQQVSHFGYDSSGTTNLFTENLGRSTIQGADVDGQILLTRDTLLRGSIQYLDNKIDQFTYTNPRGGGNLPPVTGCPVSDGTSVVNGQTVLVYNINCAGGAGYFSPKFAVNLGADQTFRFGDYKLVAVLDGRYRSSRIIGFERLPQQNSGSDTTFDASVSFAPVTDRWSLTGFVRNLTNREVPVAAQYGGSTGGSISTIYLPPRTYGVRAGVKF